jgi:hypothetical protein
MLPFPHHSLPSSPAWAKAVCLPGVPLSAILSRTETETPNAFSHWFKDLSLLLVQPLRFLAKNGKERLLIMSTWLLELAPGASQALNRVCESWLHADTGVSLCYLPCSSAPINIPHFPQNPPWNSPLGNSSSGSFSTIEHGWHQLDTPPILVPYPLPTGKD